MMKVLFFQQIVDSDSDNIKSKSALKTLLQKRVSKIKKALEIDGISIDTENSKELTFNTENGKKTQFRTSFYITKTTQKMTWNDIYKIVNSIKTTSYSFR